MECDIVDPIMFGLRMTCLSLALSDVLNMIERLTAVSRGTIEQLSRQFHCTINIQWQTAFGQRGNILTRLRCFKYFVFFTQIFRLVSIGGAAHRDS